MMRLGINGTHDSGSPGTIVAGAAAAAGDGFAGYWLGQAFGPDAMTALGACAAHAPGIELGVAVVPIWTRSPQTLAGQALSTDAMCGGRLTVGIGLSHPSVVEGMWGQRFDRPARRAQEYLRALVPLLDGKDASVQGETLTFSGRMLYDSGHPPPPVLLGALGPRMLAVAGAFADGTVTGSTGLRVLGDHIVPAVREAAERADRPDPRIVTNVVTVVTDDEHAVRERLRHRLEDYGRFPSFKAMLELEGVSSQADIALVGDEDRVTALVEEYEAAGVTDLVFAELGATPEESDRTRALTSSLARQRNTEGQP